jgi:hypothetical protein
MSRIIRYSKFESKRNFGVEFEINNTVPKYRIKNIIKSVSNRQIQMSYWGKDNGNTYWHIKDDSSCGPQGMDGPRGFEIASYVGSGIDDIIHMADVADLLQEKKVEVTPHCGLHIHADCSDLTVLQVGTIVAYWLKIEYILGMALPQRRRGNIFCRYMHQGCNWRVDRRANYTAQQVWDLFKPENLSEQDNDERRVTLNLVNYARAVWYKWYTRKTIELRWPEGTLDGRNIKNWLRLFLHFIETVKNKPMPEHTDHCTSLAEALTILGLHHSDDEFLILSEGLMDTKTWLLERIWYFLYWEGDRYASKEKEQYSAEARRMLNYMWTPLGKYTVVEDIYPYDL